MTYTYKLLPYDNILNTPANNVLRLPDNAFIPMNEANTDYQEYLEWLADGNTPEEAE